MTGIIRSHTISFIAAVILSAFFSVAIHFLPLFQDSFTTVLLVSLAFFILVFAVFYLLLENFVYKIILRAIHKYRTPLVLYRKRPLISSSGTGQAIMDELSGWAWDRKVEIERSKKLELYRKEYLGNVSHELKTPVFNIQGYVLTLLDGALEDPNVNREYLVRAEKSVERMINMIEDLEAISQLETGELTLEMETFDIVSLVKEVFQSQELTATTKGIMFDLRDHSGKPVMVMADRFRIRQVLTNLIVNSIKYGREYGQTRISFFDAGANITVEVSDNGIGIAPEHINRLFERFYRVDKSRSREQGGTGLGLSIVKHIIEAHGQSISVTSKQGEGSTFSFSLKKG
jgi:two-component system phosphate regulon sensor histidine kinase PhoR